MLCPTLNRSFGPKEDMESGLIAFLPEAFSA